MKRRKLHRTIFVAAGIYNICWGLWVTYDPYWLFRFADMPLPDYPELFVCVAMVVGLYGVVYLEIARKPEKGFVLALVGFVGKILGPLGVAYFVYIEKWEYPALIMNLTNDIIWLIPFGIYLVDSFPYFRRELEVHGD